MIVTKTRNYGRNKRRKRASEIKMRGIAGGHRKIKLKTQSKRKKRGRTRKPRRLKERPGIARAELVLHAER